MTPFMESINIDGWLRSCILSHLFFLLPSFSSFDLYRFQHFLLFLSLELQLGLEALQLLKEFFLRSLLLFVLYGKFIELSNELLLLIHDLLSHNSFISSFSFNPEKFPLVLQVQFLFFSFQALVNYVYFHLLDIFHIGKACFIPSIIFQDCTLFRVSINYRLTIDGFRFQNSFIKFTCRTKIAVNAGT